MKRLLVAVTAVVAVVLSAAPAHADNALTVRVPNESETVSTAKASITLPDSLELTAAESGEDHGASSDGGGEDDGTDMVTFFALFLGGLAVVLGIAALLRVGHRIPR